VPRGWSEEPRSGEHSASQRGQVINVDREDQLVGVGQGVDQQVAQPVDVDAPAGQRIVGAAPAAPVGRLQAELGHRGDRWGAQQRVAQLEQRVRAAGEAGVQLGPEGAEPRQGEGWHRHSRAA
jgi:hypothetical protein